MFRRILVAVDGSEGSRRAVREAVILAREMETPLHILAVEDHLPRFAATIAETKEAVEELDHFYQGVLGQASAIAAEQLVTATSEIRRGNAAEMIVQRARELDVDLVIVGRNPHLPLRERLIGTTSHRVADLAPCDVLIA